MTKDLAEATGRLKEWIARPTTFEHPRVEDVSLVVERCETLEAVLRAARRQAVFTWTMESQKWKPGLYQDFVAKVGVPEHIAAMDEILGDTIADEP